MRSAAHITTPKYRRNRAVQANPRSLDGEALNRRKIRFPASGQSAALAYDGRTGPSFGHLPNRKAGAGTKA